MRDHRCGEDCRVCQDRAERRVSRTFESRSDEEHETRHAEDRYERQFYGD